MKQGSLTVHLQLNRQPMAASNQSSNVAQVQRPHGKQSPDLLARQIHGHQLREGKRHTGVGVRSR